MEKRACANMKGFDDLPPAVRRAVHGFPDVGDTSDINDVLKRLGHGRNGAQHAAAIEAQILHLIEEQEGVWLASMNRKHCEKYGRDMPHVAARATMCRPSSQRLY